MRKTILISAVFFLAFVNIIPSFLEKNQRQRTMAATVMISIATPNWQKTAQEVEEVMPVPPDEYQTIARADGDVIAEGLGTLVANDDGTLLVTHDHWSRFDQALGTVTFRAADGRLLAEMTLPAFKQHLRYRDGGTMVLTAPDALATAVAGRAEVAQTNVLTIGDNVLLAQRAGGRVVVTEASVVAQSEKQGRPVIRLQSADGQTVIGGDSGGGVWVNGRLAATIWATVMMENATTGRRRATDLSVAAIYAPIPSAQS